LQKSSRAAVALGIMAMVAGCPAAPTPQTRRDRPMPSGAELARVIMQTDPYDQWAQFPEAQGTMASAFPHGPMARTFINGVMATALTDLAGSAPDGAIIVKENLGDSTAPLFNQLTLMWKVTGFNPDGGDWFWATFSTGGEVVAEGILNDCLSCHRGAESNDFIFLHRFPARSPGQ
jgi:hypothetical protein